MPAERFPLFDSLRALAALSIVFFHGLFQQAVLAGAGEALWRFGRNLDVGVPIFFGISGFLLYRPFVKARAEGRGLPSLRRYGLRRALRIVPAFWVALTVVTIWFGAIETRSLEGFVTYYLFLQVYDPDTAVRMIGQAWSLNVEVVFYATLPLWGALALKLRNEWYGLAALFAASLAWQVFALSQASPADPRDVVWLLVFPSWVDHLVIGMGLAVLSVRGSAPAWLGSRRLWLVALVLWLACGLLEGGGALVSDRAYFARHLLYGVIVACVLGPAVFGPRRPSRLMAWIGTVSYSLYLIHLAVIAQILLWWQRLPDGAEWVLWMAEILAGSLLLAAVGYHLVERPFIRLGSFRRTAQEHAAP